MQSIENLGKFINETEFLVVGCPKGVGFTTYMANFIAEMLFFNESYKCLVLTNNSFETALYLQTIKDSLFSNYEFSNCELKNNKLSITKTSFVEVYLANDNFQVDKNVLYDLFVIDNEFGKPIYYKILENNKNFKKVVVGTYDFSDSLYYKVENNYKIRIYSQFSDENIKNLYNRSENYINEEILVRGDFGRY